MPGPVRHSAAVLHNKVLIRAGCHINPDSSYFQTWFLIMNRSGDAAPRLHEGSHDDLVKPFCIGEETRSNRKAVVWRLWGFKNNQLYKLLYFELSPP